MTETKLAWIEEELAALRESGLFINLRVIDSPPGAWMVVDGKRVLNLCTNNYLGLASDPRLKHAAQKAIDAYGVGPTAVRSIAGTLAVHTELERTVAAFKGVEDALYVQAGFVANQAALAPLVGREDVIFSDRLNHASIIDGARLSRAKIVVYEHADPADLATKVAEHLPQYRRGLVVTDGVFSMDGDIAPLDEIYGVAERYGLMTMVDDAHGEGVVGHGGRGIVDHFGLHGKFDVEIGTFSKAFGVVGGIVAGKKVIVDYLRQKARPFLFSSAVTAADTAACLAAVNVLAGSTDLVDRLWQNTRTFKSAMRGLGFDIGNSVTPITPVMLGDVKLAKAFSRRLFEEGVFAMALGFPTVPVGMARIRVMISAALSDDDLDFGLQQFEKVGRELGTIPAR
ncbi:MAG: glycine C-acetyltransferase [Anaerolineae bacterium]|nr:glycine C-acetyltransferase [Anaerolineae bacterium]